MGRILKPFSFLVLFLTKKKILLGVICIILLNINITLCVSDELSPGNSGDISSPVCVILIIMLCLIFLGNMDKYKSELEKADKIRNKEIMNIERVEPGENISQELRVSQNLQEPDSLPWVEQDQSALRAAQDAHNQQDYLNTLSDKDANFYLNKIFYGSPEILNFWSAMFIYSIFFLLIIYIINKEILSVFIKKYRNIFIVLIYSLFLFLLLFVKI